MGEVLEHVVYYSYNMNGIADSDSCKDNTHIFEPEDNALPSRTQDIVHTKIIVINFLCRLLAASPQANCLLVSLQPL